MSRIVSERIGFPAVAQCVAYTMSKSSDTGKTGWSPSLVMVDANSMKVLTFEEY